jgi:uncharacterized protein (DUF1499 family)
MRWLTIGLTAVVGLPLLLLAAGQAGLLSGRMPDDLGVSDGRLKAPCRTDNCVSSQADLWPGAAHRDAVRIEPLALRDGDGQATLARLRELAADWPGAQVVNAGPDYLHLSFRTRWLGFVDDAEFWVDPQRQVLHVRSASRVGRRDFGVNRQRVEHLRARLAAR